ncbi:MAG: hypothetical protein H0S77_11435 [Spirochaetaceae bacterium]|jgi:hypothetical protein|nr:hypothetical protein [Spirochaetaceae bacterium]
MLTIPLQLTFGFVLFENLRVVPDQPKEGVSLLLSWKQDATNKTRKSYASGILSQGIGARNDYHTSK